jgi:hypothetical protein
MTELDVRLLETRFSNEIGEENFITLKDIFNTIGAEHISAAGGSVLSAYTDGVFNDIDIYMHWSQAEEVLNLLQSKFSDVVHLKNEIIPKYDDSFLRKNNVVSQSSLIIRDVIEIDLMIIPDDVSIESVVSHFYLTFCQVWWDGEKVKATHPEHIQNKHGALTKDYIESFLQGNKFIHFRLKKYQGRGFVIDLPCKEDLKIPRTSRYKTVSDPNDYVVRLLYSGLVRFYGFIYASEIVFVDEHIARNPMKDFSLESLHKVIDARKGETEAVIGRALKSYHDYYIVALADTRMYNKQVLEDYIIGKNIPWFYKEDDERNLQVALWVERVTGITRDVFLSENKRIWSRIMSNGYRTLPVLSQMDVRSIEPVKRKEYSERDLTQRKGCYDIIGMEYYDIVKYLKGEEIQGVDNEGKDTENPVFPAVDEFEARKRLVFFVGTTLENVRPYCYSTDLLEYDIKTKTFSDCKGVEGDRYTRHAKYHFPSILKLDFEYPVYVHLPDLMKVITETNKQVFLLLPSGLTYENTHSYDAYVNYRFVSSDHCNAPPGRATKSIHDIFICDSDEENKCFPVIEELGIKTKPELSKKQQKRIQSSLENDIERIRRSELEERSGRHLRRALRNVEEQEQDEEEEREEAEEEREEAAAAEEEEQDQDE